MYEYLPKIQVEEEFLDRRLQETVRKKSEFTITFRKEFQPSERRYIWKVLKVI